LQCLENVIVGLPSSLRVAVVAFIVIIVVFLAVAFIFLIVLFLVWLFPKKDIASRRAIRTVCVEALWAYSGHVHMVLCARWQEQRGQLRALAHGLAMHESLTNPASV
jgi:hypothetical protein